MASFIESAKSTINLEAEGLKAVAEALSQGLAPDFEKAA